MDPIPVHVTWLVSALLIVAAVIDGVKLKVPNWLTFPMALSGLVFVTSQAGASGFLWSLGGLVLGLVLLLPLYAIGGMGAGDVKLLAGVGAWLGPEVVLGAFMATALIGGVMAVVMIVQSGRVAHHVAQCQQIASDIVTIRNPEVLAAQAAERKPRMRLLPYGIPMAIGSILFFAWNGMFT